MKTSPCRLLAFALLATLGVTGTARAQNLIVNGGFENKDASWRSFIPADSASHNLEFTVIEQGVRSGRGAARLDSPDTVSRFGIGNRTWLDVTAGERYRLSVWYRAEPGAILAAWGPGLVLRATFFGADKKAAAENLHVGPGGAVSSSPGREIREPRLAEEWTRVSAVIEIPAGVAHMQLNVFLWGMQGALLLDDVMLEPVSAE